MASQVWGRMGGGHTEGLGRRSEAGCVWEKTVGRVGVGGFGVGSLDVRMTIPG